jgi:hypothetical protein
MLSIQIRKPIVVAVVLLLAALVITACGGGASGGEDGADERRGDTAGAGLPQGSEPVELSPAEFTTDIDNPYWPMQPGSRWAYRERGGEGGPQRVVVTVTGRTKRIANGIKARVVRDVVSRDGQPVEVTSDWYAQDAAGNLWYLGESTAEYEKGKVVSTAGSWEAGVDGAQPGIVLPANLRPGLVYRQEYYAGQAEDRAKVLSVEEQVQVPFGHFSGAVLTKDETPLEPRVVEYKLYAPGVGPVLTLDVSGEAGREELTEFTG